MSNISNLLNLSVQYVTITLAKPKSNIKGIPDENYKKIEIINKSQTN